MTPSMPGTVPFAVLFRVSFCSRQDRLDVFPVRDGGDLEDGWEEGLAIEEDLMRVGARKAR